MTSAIVYIATAGIALPVLLTYLVKMRHKKILKNIIKNQSSCYYQCIFVTIKTECRQHIIDSNPCENDCALNGLQTLVTFIASAKTSISLCMYHLTLKTISEEVLKAHKKGVEVRIITDGTTSKIESSQMRHLRHRYGFKVLVPPNDSSLMHHKFGLIDVEDLDAAKMFFGSLNFTLQGLVANYETIVFTNNKDIIQRYREEYDFMWNDFNEHKTYLKALLNQNK